MFLRGNDKYRINCEFPSREETIWDAKMAETAASGSNSWLR